MRWHLSAFLVLADTCVAMAEPKLSTEEAARRAAIQDQIGNRCPLVEPDYTMRLMLATQYKNGDPLKWGNAYAAATKEMVDKFEADGEEVCRGAMDLYGPKGRSIPHLVNGRGPA
jgi:hypothetical protein